MKRSIYGQLLLSYAGHNFNFIFCINQDSTRVIGKGSLTYSQNLADFLALSLTGVCTHFFSFSYASLCHVPERLNSLHTLDFLSFDNVNSLCAFKLSSFYFYHSTLIQPKFHYHIFALLNSHNILTFSFSITASAVCSCQCFKCGRMFAFKMLQ